MSDTADVPDRGTMSKLEALFSRALELPPAERASFVREGAGGDEALADEVLALLATDEKAAGMLDIPLGAVLGPWMEQDSGDRDATPAAIETGHRIGPYRIVGEIGRGGMGVVYDAERADGAYEQRVALKVVHAGLVTTELERRFLRERQILARLDHPGIARLLHGGATGDGRPYLAMQRVEGEPITAWVSRRDSDLETRLRLFLEVCDAVRYAHRQLVVHRDLKPSNILVTAEGGVRLLDFGIAHLLSTDPEDENATRAGALLLTPEYAAPEQLLGEPATTSTDVYALGVLLHELLTGVRPAGGGFASMAELLRHTEEEAPPPSRTPGLDAAARRRLEGDLDAIVSTALRKSPERRYPSVEALADDVRAHLARRPVQARAATRAYRLGRFVRRHRAGVASAAVIVIAILGGLAGTTRMATVARREAARSEAVRDFLFGLWTAADPAANGGTVPDAIDLVDRGVARVDSLGADAGAEVRVDMLATLGFLYQKLGRPDRSVSLFERAAAEARDAFGADERTGAALDGLAQSLLDAGRAEDAEAAARESLRIRKQARSTAENVASSYSALGGALNRLGRYDEALDAHRSALELDRRAGGARTPAVASDLNNLAAAERRLGRLDEAEEHYRASLAIRREQLGPTDPELAVGLGNLAAVRRDAGALDEAETLQHEALEIRTTVLGPDHPDVAISLEQIGLTLQAAGRYEAADSLVSEALELRRRVLGPRHPSTLETMNNLATIRFRRGRYAWAADVQEEVVEARRAERPGLDDDGTLTMVSNLGVMRLRSGDLAAAERHFIEVLDARRRLFDADHPNIGTSLRWLAELRRVQGRHAEAAALGEEALAIFTRHFPDDHPRVADARVTIGAALIDSGSARDAIPLLRSALAAREARLPAGTAEIAEARVWLGAAVARAGARAEARTLLETAIADYESLGRADEAAALRAREEIAALR